jgi:hypothetical protein
MSGVVVTSAAYRGDPEQEGIDRVVEQTGQQQPDAVTNAMGPFITRPQAPEAGTYANFRFTGASTDVPQRVIGRDPDRVYAEIRVAGTGPLWVGTREQCSAALGGQASGGGYLLPTGQVLSVHHQQEVWVTSDGAHDVVAYVANERRTHQ